MKDPQRIPKIKITKMPNNTKIAVITALWNTDLTQNMEKECLKELNRHKIKIKKINVAGSFELIAAAKVALVKKYDAVIVLGVVLNGETPHFDYVCQGVTQGIMQVSLTRSKPIGFGVLTVDTVEQAIARSGIAGSKEDKGFDATVAALELLKVKRDLPVLRKS